MKSLWAAGTAAVCAVAMVSVSSAADAPLTGFKAASGAAELRAEASFDGAIDAAEMRSWMQQMASAPNQVGSPHDKANADFTLAKFREWGWDARIETFDVLYPTPMSVALELVAPTTYKAVLSEPAVAGDGTSGHPEGGLPPYNAYSADGDVTADLVYVNHGNPEDYVELERRGIDVAGKIVIARYGTSWRGLRPKLAHEHGAIGCIIYSDPHEDGFFAGDPYPKGGTRPDAGVQRGSVADITQYSGDPLTPGVGATAKAKRLAVADAPTIQKIPCIPISYGDALPLLSALGGAVVPEPWRGALPITYHFGPGPAKVHLAVSSDWSLKTIYDVIAVIRGSTYPDQWVIRGNHHDGWFFGAWDPLSGNVSVMAEAKAIGTLAKAGWKPKRTIVYASWDGEEPGLLGSTEWAETHADELRHKAVLYVNSDTNARGFLFAGGSHAFEHAVNEAAGAVPDPETGASVIERLRSRVRVGVNPYAGGSEREAMRLAADAGGDLPLDGLGSGSDYTPFLQHLGISSVNLGFGGEDSDAGIYHSMYDSFDHFVRFGDPKFDYEVALARTAGRIVLRTADADVVPMRFTALARAVQGYADDIARLADDERDESRRVQKLIDQGAYRQAADPEERYEPPKSPGEVPPIDFSALRKAAARLARSAAAYDEAFDRASGNDFRLPPAEVARLNELLQGVEQELCSPRGLPGRDWYQHMLYAPGRFTGYGAKTIPALREAVEDRRWSDATAYMPVVSGVLEAAASRLDEAATQLTPRLGVGQAMPRVTPPPPPDGL